MSAMHQICTHSALATVYSDSTTNTLLNSTNSLQAVSCFKLLVQGVRSSVQNHVDTKTHAGALWAEDGR